MVLERTVYNKYGNYCEIFIGDSRQSDLDDESVHLIITSPPYFNAKDYEQEGDMHNIGDINDYSLYLQELLKVWNDCYRVLCGGRKMFVNVMNLPIKSAVGSFRTLNLMGDVITACEDVGFVYKREIVWNKTNGPRAHFGSYPYPGGILINTMHEFILEFEKPLLKAKSKKYSHVSVDDREASKLSKDFWLSLKNSSVWTMTPHPSGVSRDHVSIFPEDLPDRLIRGYSFINEIVYDPFAGSGTTGRVGLRNKRNAVIYEINKRYLDLIVERVKEES